MKPNKDTKEHRIQRLREICNVNSYNAGELRSLGFKDEAEVLDLLNTNLYQRMMAEAKEL